MLISNQQMVVSRGREGAERLFVTWTLHSPAREEEINKKNKKPKAASEIFGTVASSLFFGII